MNKTKKLFKREQGQSLVEFALVLPVLMLILLGIVEFGWMFNAKITLTSAAREAARVYAIHGNDPTLINKAVTDATKNLIIEGPLTITPKALTTMPTSDGKNSIKMAKVEISGNIKPLVGFIITSNVNMKAEASMRVEYVVP